jgi:hypothetical protein
VEALAHEENVVRALEALQIAAQKRLARTQKFVSGRPYIDAEIFRVKLQMIRQFSLHCVAHPLLVFAAKP